MVEYPLVPLGSSWSHIEAVSQAYQNGLMLLKLNQVAATDEMTARVGVTPQGYLVVAPSTDKVAITVITASGGELTSSMSAAQIYAAVQDGEIVVATYASKMYMLYSATLSAATFSATTIANESTRHTERINVIGTSAFLTTKDDEGGGGGAVSSVNGKTGAVVLNASDVGAYTKPSGGIPASDLSSTTQESLMLANEAYQLPASGIPESDLASAVKGKLSVANPAGAATATLSKLNIGGTIYSVPQGGGGGVTKYTVTLSGSASPYTASMSSSEIYTAVQGGNIVEAAFDGEVLALTKSTSSVALFVGHALTENEFIGLAIAISGTAALTTPIPIQPKNIADTGGYFTTDTVEGALAEIGAQLDGIETALDGINDVLEGAL